MDIGLGLGMCGVLYFRRSTRIQSSGVRDVRPRPAIGVIFDRFSRNMAQSFRDQLTRQLGFLRRSCDAYDANKIDDAIRIAVAIRVLIHDTKKSISLLNHLGATTINLLSTAEDPSPQSFFYIGLGSQIVKVTLDTTSAAYVPLFDDGPIQRLVPVSKWWNQVVYVLNPKTRLTRKDIVLAATNQDGGAHVDSKLDPNYEALAKEGAVGTLMNQRKEMIAASPFTDAHFVAIRQMGYELLHSPDLVSLSSTT